uniref:Band 7 domain-containing protein n=1 Tax=viral metagenome TaxID=1070528 RepID=A0A6C0J6R3_9ZZZZ
MLFETIAALSILGLSLTSIFECQQGHRCVIYRGGSLLKDITEPGFNYKAPFVTRAHNVQVTWQTDRVENIICGSSQGGSAYLDVEVVNKLNKSDDCILKVVGEHTIGYDKPLIFDYIPSEVAQFCKNYTLDDIVIREFDKLDEILLGKLRLNIDSYGLSDCLEIKNVRINRPKLNDDMVKKFESIENEKKAMELAEKEKETQRVKLESKLQKELMEMDRLRKTTEIEMEIQISKARAFAEKQLINDRMNLETRRNDAEGEKISLIKKSEGYNTLLSNPEYIKLETMRTAYHNSKIVIGEIPKNSIFNFDFPKTGYTDYMSFMNETTF